MAGQWLTEWPVEIYYDYVKLHIALGFGDKSLATVQAKSSLNEIGNIHREVVNFLLTSAVQSRRVNNIIGAY